VDSLRETESANYVPASSRFFLVEEKSPDFSYDMFNNALSEGRPGFLISRDYPAELTKKYGLPDCKIIWLTHLVGENYLNPTSLGIIISIITKFLESCSKATIMLDGIEYLISQNNYERILHFIHQLRDLVIIHDGMMIMPVDARVLDEKQLALLERNLEVLVPPEKYGRRRFTFELEDGLLKVLKSTER